MVDLHDQHAGEVIRRPLLVEVISFLLLDAVIAWLVEALAIDTLQVFVRRAGAKAAKVCREVAVEDHQRILGLRVVIKAFGDKYVAANEHIRAPEFRQLFTAHLEVADIFCVFRLFDIRQNRIELDVDHLLAVRVKADLFRLTDDVAGLKPPVLSGATCRRQLHCLSVRQVEGVVFVQDGLNIIVASRDIIHVDGWEAQRAAADLYAGAGFHAVYCDAENLRCVIGLLHLEAGLCLAIRSDDENDASILGFFYGLL